MMNRVGQQVKFIEFVPRLADMSPREFHLYWQRHHSPHVMNVTAFAQYMRKYNTAHRCIEGEVGLPGGLLESHPFDGAAEVWLDDLDVLTTWLGHPLYDELIRPDEPRFISQDGSAEFVIVKEEMILGDIEDMEEGGLTKAHLLIDRLPGASRESFHADISDWTRALGGMGQLSGHLVKLSVGHKVSEPLPLETLQMSSIDAVVECWFEQRAYAIEFLTRDAFAQHLLPRLMGISGRRRTLLSRMRVVHDELSFQASVTHPVPFRLE